MSDGIEYREYEDHQWNTLPEEVRQARTRELFKTWSRRLLISASAHYMQARRLQALEFSLSVLNLCFAISVLFFAANQDLQAYVQNRIGDTFEVSIVTPILSLGVVLSSALQYIAQFGAKAQSHKAAGNEFSNLRRKLERYWVKGIPPAEAIHNFNRAYNMISKGPPLVGQRIWRKAQKKRREEVESYEKFYDDPGS